MLQRLKKDEVFDEMSHGYRLGIALAIARGGLAAPEDTTMVTILNVGSLDPDGSIRDLITELYPQHAHRPYAFAERLAEAGVEEMGDCIRSVSFASVTSSLPRSRSRCHHGGKRACH